MCRGLLGWSLVGLEMAAQRKTTTLPLSKFTSTWVSMKGYLDQVDLWLHFLGIPFITLKWDDCGLWVAPFPTQQFLNCGEEKGTEFKHKCTNLSRSIETGNNMPE